MTNKKILFLRVCAILFAVLFAVLMFFMPFVNNKNNTVNVYADSVDSYGFTFNSSALYLPLTFIKTSSDGYPSSISNFGSIAFVYSNDDSNQPSFKLNSSFIYYNGSFNDNFKTNDDLHSLSYGQWTNFTDIPYFDEEMHLVSYHLNGLWVMCEEFMGVPVGVNIKYNFSSDSVWNFEYFDIDSHKLYINVYFDKTKFYYGSESDDNGFLTSFNFRTYYFSNALDLSSNTYYQQGYSDGSSAGDSAGFSRGYQSGYAYGYSVGERTGFNDGLNSANTYSFLNLFGAIVDAPLQAFTGLFDFNLSFDGVNSFNLKGFFLALLSIAIVIAIIRFALRK